MLYKRAKTTHANSNNQLIAGDRCLGNSIASITGLRVTLVVAAAAKPSITRLQIRHQLIVMRRCRRRSLRSSNGNVFRRASRVRPPVGRSLAARPSARPAPASNCTGRHARESRDNFDESAAPAGSVVGVRAVQLPMTTNQPGQHVVRVYCCITDSTAHDSQHHCHSYNCHN